MNPRPARVPADVQWLHHIPAVPRAGSTRGLVEGECQREAVSCFADGVHSLGRAWRAEETPLHAYTKLSPPHSTRATVALGLRHMLERGARLASAAFLSHSGSWPAWAPRS